MTTVLSKPFPSDSQAAQARRRFIFGLGLIATLWLGATLLLDLVVMPSMANAGMMTSSSFMPAGFGLFQRFNGIELMAGALMLTGSLLLLSQDRIFHRFRFGFAASLLFVIPMIYFYYLSPQMAGLGLSNPGAAPASMDSMHLTYWGLDLLKASCVALYVNELWQSLNQGAQTL